MSEHAAGHRKRLKEKYLASSNSLVYDYEALELLLTYSIPRIDVKPIAKELLNQFGSMDNVLNANPTQLQKVNGVGPNTAILISLIKDISVRASKSRSENTKMLNNPKTAIQFFQNMLAEETIEKFLLVTIDNSNKIISCHTLAEGETDYVNVDPRRMFEMVLFDNAPRVMIAHNHPHGNADPSAFDIDFTLKVRNILNSLQIELEDHIIIGETDSLSMRNSYHYSKYFVKE